MDVFQSEPLPKDSPLWHVKGVRLTPHIAGLPHPSTAAAIVAENYRRLVAGEDLLYVVDKEQGY